MIDSSAVSLSAHGLSKRYSLGERKGMLARLKHILGGNALVECEHESFFALSDVSFLLHSGDVVGVIGSNGSGKSTLLKILSKIVSPTSGHVSYRGRLGALLEVGTGFHPELTGLENIYLGASFLGLSRSEIAERLDQIVHFAEIEGFLDTPVKFYSSGMYMRLAFSVASHLDPDILLIDETLAVGDEQFQKKCLGRIDDITGDGRTVVIVSHNLPLIASICNRAFLLEKGRLIMDDRPAAVIEKYRSEIYKPESANPEISRAAQNKTSHAVIEKVSIRPSPSRIQDISLIYPGDDLLITVSIKGSKDLKGINVSVVIRNEDHVRVIDANLHNKNKLLSLRKNEAAEIEFRLLDLLLKPGAYYLTVSIGIRGVEHLDLLPDVSSFRVEFDPNCMSADYIYPGIYQCRFEEFVKKIS